MECTYRFFRNGELLSEYTETELLHEFPGWDGKLEIGDRFTIGKEIVRVTGVNQYVDEKVEINDYHVRGIQADQKSSV